MPLSYYTCYKRHKYNVGCWNILRKSYIYRNTQVDVEVDATLRYPTAANTQVNVPFRRPSLAPTLHWASFFTQVYATLREPSLPNAGLRSLTQAYAALRRSFVEDSQAYADEFVNWEYAGLRRLTLPFVRYSVSPPLSKTFPMSVGRWFQAQDAIHKSVHRLKRAHTIANVDLRRPAYFNTPAFAGWRWRFAGLR